MSRASGRSGLLGCPGMAMLGEAAEKLAHALRIIGGTTDEYIAEIHVSPRVMAALAREQGEEKLNPVIIRTVLSNVIVRERP